MNPILDAFITAVITVVSVFGAIGLALWIEMTIERRQLAREEREDNGVSE